MSRERLYSYSTTSKQSDGLDHSSRDLNVQRNQSIEGMLVKLYHIANPQFSKLIDSMVKCFFA
jgi:hypothetical protein